MTATLPDGRAVFWSPRSPHLYGDPALVARVRAWLDLFEQVNVTPTGPSVPSDEADPLAAYTAMVAVMPLASWWNPPDLSFGLPPGTVSEP